MRNTNNISSTYYYEEYEYEQKFVVGETICFS